MSSVDRSDKEREKQDVAPRPPHARVIITADIILISIGTVSVKSALLRGTLCFKQRGNTNNPLKDALRNIVGNRETVAANLGTLKRAPIAGGAISSDDIYNGRTIPRQDAIRRMEKAQSWISQLPGRRSGDSIWRGFHINLMEISL